MLTPRNTTLTVLSSAIPANLSIALSALGSIRCTEEKSKNTSPSTLSSFSPASCKAWTKGSSSAFSHTGNVVIVIRTTIHQLFVAELHWPPSPGLAPDKRSRTVRPIRSAVACEGSTYRKDRQRQSGPNRVSLARIRPSRSPGRRSNVESPIGRVAVLSPLRGLLPFPQSYDRPDPISQPPWHISCGRYTPAGSARA